LDVLKDVKTVNEDEKTGVNIIRRALEEPLRQIIANAGEEASVIIQDVRKSKGTAGYNALTGKHADMFADGIIDPTKVARVARENAASVAGMLLTTECVLADEPEEAPAGGGGMPGGMGGMGGMM